MLAYVFWHWKRPDAARDEYEAALVEFQQALAAARPAGLRGAVIVRLKAAPWIRAAAEAYEEWYLLDGSQTLDVLNDAAVAGSCKAPHDRAAALAEGGFAGLYRLRSGAGAVADASAAGWFAKPPGMTYPQLQTALADVVDAAQAGLWRRQMVLGPAPEFCLLAPQPLRLPAGFDAIWLPRVNVWRK